MKLDKTQPVPLYSQVEKMLEEKIVSGQWSEGYQIPTEKELAKSLDVSNITVKRAVINLVDKGMLYRQRGRGTFVASTATEKNIYKSAFFTTENEVSSSHKILDRNPEAVKPSIADILVIDADEKMVFIKRVGIEDGDPVSIEYTYIPHSVCPEIMSIGENDFIYDILKKKCGINLTYTKNYFSAAVANEEESALLDVGLNTPLFVWERVTYSSTNHPVEYSKFIMRQDKEKYYLEVPLT